MLENNDKLYSVNGKRLVLVAEDEEINQALLGAILESDYEVLFASDGQEALEKIREHRRELALVFLDLMMPVMTGKEVLRQLKIDPELQKIPVIVLTADQKAEVESLELGAVDFIPKPYPGPEIILARARRTIELSEDRQLINSTERDPLTGLYNKEFFYQYAEQYDRYHPEAEMDAICLDIMHFHILNDRFGRAAGDRLLQRTGKEIERVAEEAGGLACRREADRFMIYCPHGADYQAVLDGITEGIWDEELKDHPIHFRMGVYPGVNKELRIEHRFDRAKMAADAIRTSFTKSIEFYDEKAREKELFAERLVDDFKQAIAEEQFTVFYQPKFNVQAEPPILSSAEALIRWKHPELGMISPGVFIPLFEENGLIQELDHYVWQKSAAQIRDWKQRFGYSVPVSVNVSRVDLYDPEIQNYLQSVVSDNGLSEGELYLEITESAYYDNTNKLIETVKDLRSMGLPIEMDDFGTGYSSLNMITKLPFDVLKLDMTFVRSAFEGGKDTWLLKVLVDIAAHLCVPVIAEGVETEEQMKALKEIDCDIVQGYYFSKPVPPEEFEPFLVEYGKRRGWIR